MSALDRARDWLIAPPPESSTTDGWSAPPTAPDRDDAWHGRDSTAPDRDDVRYGRDSTSPERDDVRHRRGSTSPERDDVRHRRDSTAPERDDSPPAVPDPDDPPPTSIRGFAPPTPAHPASAGLAASVSAPPAPSRHGDAAAARRDAAAAVEPRIRPRRSKRPTRPLVSAPPADDEPVRLAEVAVVTSAAVLGRPGEAEPVAAALALALRLQTRAKAATVAVVGEVPPDVELGSAGAAARRLADRLEAHGLAPQARGRLAWVELEPADAQFVSAVRRVTLLAAPAVLAVTSARTPAVDAALNEQDLLVLVTADPDGPLAQLAVAGLADVPIVTVRPLGRGPARALARAGIRPARSVRQVLAADRERRE